MTERSAPPEHPEVLAAAAAWVYVPDDAREVRTDELHVVAYPEHWADPTAARVLSGDRPAAAVVDDLLAVAASLGRHVVDVWVTEATRPADLAEHLLARGAVVHEELAVLARPLGASADLPDLAPPADVEVVEVADLATARDAERVAVEVFGGTVRDDAALQRSVDEATVEDGVALVAHRDGRAVGTAGLTVVDGVARLWGGAVLEDARGTGVYRALLDHRLRTAVGHGCTLALVRGRLTTSAPVLGRAGFTPYGTETSYRLG